MYNQANRAYQQTSVQTTPAQLLIMLYDGAIRFTKAGIEGVQQRRYDYANTNFKKAQSIIHELMASLNFDYEISKNLSSLYEYFLHQLIQANVKKDVKPAEEVLIYFYELRETWRECAKNAGSQIQMTSGKI